MEPSFEVVHVSFAAAEVIAAADITKISIVLAVPFPQALEGVTVSVPEVVAFRVMLFPEPVMAPVPLYDHV